MLNKTICKKCVDEGLRKCFCEQTGTWTLEDIKKEMPYLDHQIGDWFEKVTSGGGKVPCPIVDSSKCHGLMFEPLQLEVFCTSRSNPPTECPYVLEHTVTA
jgi:hypothetical protein